MSIAIAITWGHKPRNDSEKKTRLLANSSPSMISGGTWANLKSKSTWLILAVSVVLCSQIQIFLTSLVYLVEGEMLWLIAELCSQLGGTLVPGHYCMNASSEWHNQCKTVTLHVLDSFCTRGTSADESWVFMSGIRTDTSLVCADLPAEHSWWVVEPALWCSACQAPGGWRAW